MLCGLVGGAFSCMGIGIETVADCSVKQRSIPPGYKEYQDEEKRFKLAIPKDSYFHGDTTSEEDLVVSPYEPPFSPWFALSVEPRRDIVENYYPWSSETKGSVYLSEFLQRPRKPASNYEELKVDSLCTDAGRKKYYVIFRNDRAFYGRHHSIYFFIDDCRQCTFTMITTQLEPAAVDSAERMAFTMARSFDRF